MFLTKVISTSADAVSRFIIKVRRYGMNDVHTAYQANPFGFDSNPIANIRAAFSKTDDKSVKVIVGYVNTDQRANVGESRIFSTDDSGELKFYVWLKNDGTLLLGGDAGNLARYQELETAFNQLKSDHNDLVNAFNTHMHATAATGPPVIPTPGSGIPASPSTADITGAKINEIKTL